MTEDRRPTRRNPPDRRAFIRAGAAIGGTAWIAPVVLSAPAAAQGSVPPDPVSFGGYQSESLAGSSSITVTMMNLNDPGLLVVLLGMRGATTWSDPGGWAIAGSTVDTDNDGAMAIYTKPVASPTESVTFTLGATATNVTAAMLYYRFATGAEPAGPQAYNSGDSTDMEAAAITTTGPDRIVVYGAAWETSVGSPIPAGFTNRGNVTNGALSITLDDLAQPLAGTVGPTTAVLGAATPWGAGQVAVY